MKKILISFVLVFAVISSICAVAANSVDVPNTSTVIENAVSLGITENADISLSESITREQFCEYTYNMLNSVKELPAVKLPENPFTDTNNPKITSLSFVKIVNGKGPQIFAPKDNISREEAAVILCRAAMYAGLELPSVKVDMSYSDNSSISPWAVSSVYKLKVLNIIDDIGASFMPKENFTVEQSLSALIKLYELIKK